MSGCAFCTPMTGVTVATARWDDAAAGAATGLSKFAIPSGSKSVMLVSAAAALYVAMDRVAEVYASDFITASNADGAPIYANHNADSPVVILPVPETALYLHMKGAGAVSVTFYG